MSKIHESVFLAEGSIVRGDVEIGRDSGIWYNAVIRGDAAPIKIGEKSNIQDNAVIHVDAEFPVEIGDGVTVGHGAVLHGCRIGDNTMVGMGAIVLNGAEIGKDCLIGAGALVTGRTKVPDGSLVVGNPGKVKRPLRAEEIDFNRENAERYASHAKAEKEEQEDTGKQIITGDNQ